MLEYQRLVLFISPEESDAASKAPTSHWRRPLWLMPALTAPVAVMLFFSFFLSCLFSVSTPPILLAILLFFGFLGKLRMRLPAAACCNADRDDEHADMSPRLQTERERMKGCFQRRSPEPPSPTHPPFGLAVDSMPRCLFLARPGRPAALFPPGPSLRHSQLPFSLHFGKPMWLFFFRGLGGPCGSG